MDISCKPVSNQTKAASTRAPKIESDSPYRTNDVVVEEFEVSSEALIDAIREIIIQRNVRRIVVQNEEGSSLLRIPMTVTVADTLVEIDLSCETVSLNVIAAIVTRPHIVIERAASFCT